MALTTSYFVGDISVPNISGTQAPAVANKAVLDRVILIYEEEYLRKLLGDTLYDDYIANAPDYTALTDKLYNTTKLLSPVADYCFYKWACETATYNTGGGEAKAARENATGVEFNYRKMRAFNRATMKGQEVIEWMQENASDYPDLDPDLSFFSLIDNPWGI